MQRSAGILPFKVDPDGTVMVFLASPGGPYNRDDWAIVKGRIENNELPFEAALREFKEETGYDLDTSLNFIPLGRERVRPSKTVEIYAVNVDLDESLFRCESMVYKDGVAVWPENKDGKWLNLEDAYSVLYKSQLIFLDKLKDVLTVYNK